MSDAVEPEVERLSRADRDRLASIWAERARSELGAGSAFAQVVVGLYSIGATSEVLDLATNAAHEEVEHATMCHRLAELYAGRAIEMPVPKKVGMPPHRGASDPLRATLHVVGLCCFNETIAAEFVARCLDASDAPTVRKASSKHLRDEIGHARVGWAHLASGALDASDRRAVGRWVPRLVRANGEMWLERLRMLPEEGVPGHGYPEVSHLEEGVRHAMREIIVPGFARVGIDVKNAASEAARL